jgi:hypothetical protein
MAFIQLYNSLLSKMPALDKVILDTETDERYACFDINEMEYLKNLAFTRFPNTTHVYVEPLESEGEKVFNVMFFDETGEHLSGLELTKEHVYWDDDA